MITESGFQLILITLIGCMTWSVAEKNIKRCREVNTFGYTYGQFYDINQLVQTNKEGLKFEFFVQARSDAHVLLSPTLQAGNDAYEIVIGAGQNTFSQIRLGKRVKVTDSTANMVSATEYRAFWIKLTQGATYIEVGVAGRPEPFLAWTNSRPFAANYVAFSTYSNIKGKWLVGCPDMTEKDINAEFIEDEVSLTPLQRLKSDMLSFYDPHTLPSEVNEEMVVKAGMAIHNVELDERTARLTVDGVMFLKWNDSKVRWLPNEYDNLTTLYLTPFDVWTPNMLVFSGVVTDSMFSLSQVGVVAQAHGALAWNPPVHFDSLCAVSSLGWPLDTHNCSIFMGFLLEPEQLRLDMTDVARTAANSRGGPEWSILGVATSAVEKNIWSVQVLLRRKHDTYVPLLLTPLIAVAILLLTSFWMHPLESGQTALSCVTVIVLSLLLITIGETIPTMQDGVPNIVLLYSWGLIASCLPILLAVVLKNLPPTLLLPRALHVAFTKMLSSSSTDLSIYSHLQEPQEQKAWQTTDTLVLAIVIERVAFILYLLGFVYILFLCY